MANYFIRYFTKTPISFISRSEMQNNHRQYFQFEFGSVGDIYIHSRVSINKRDEILHQGLFIDFKASYDNEDEAKKDSRKIAEDIVALLSLCTNTEAELPKRVLLAENEGTFEQRTLEGNSEPIVKDLSIVRKKHFQKILNSVYVEEPSNNLDSAMRAAHRFRKSFDVEERVDEFLWLYIGLEMLEDSLKDIYSDESSKHSGRKSLFEKLDFLDSKFKKHCDLRNEVVHDGKVSIPEDTEKELRKALRAGIFLSMDISLEDNLELIERPVKYNLKNFYSIIDGEISDFNIENTPLDAIPLFRVKKHLIDYEIQEDLLIASSDFELEMTNDDVSVNTKRMSLYLEGADSENFYLLESDDSS